MVLLVVALMMALVGSTASASSTTEVVTPADVTLQAENTPPTDEWVAYFRNAGSHAFVLGPATPPLGTGSLQLTTPTSADKITVFNFQHIGTKLSDITAIGYATYRISGQASQVASINIQVDVNGGATGGFTTLVFEPVYNTDQGSVTSGQWQIWDAFNSGNAIWWSSNAIPGAPNRDTFVPWSTIVSLNPDAVILGGFGVNQGSGNPELITAVDALKLGVLENTITYDFELNPPPPATPTCNGLPATVYVQDEVIVGGPDDGEPYDGELIGTSGDDVIVGTEGRDAINGRGGNDTICALGSDDRLEGAAGNDTMYGGSGGDRFKGGAGTDSAPDFNPAEGDRQEKVEQLP